MGKDGIHLMEVDPKKLLHVGGNRLVNEKHVDKLAKAIQRKNLLHFNPIKINRKGEISDGQHRVAAAIKLGLEKVPCLVVKDIGLEDIQLLNQNNRNWSGYDYAQSYASRGSQEYVTFIDFMSKTGLSFDAAILLLSGNDGRIYELFRAGKFKVKNLRRANDTFAMIEGFSHWCPGYNKSRSFVRAFAVVAKTPGYDHSHMIKKCELQPMRKMPNEALYLEQFETVYNYCTKVADRLRFSKGL